MFLTGPLDQIAAGPLINAVGTRMVFVIAASRYVVGSAPFAIYVARNRSLGDPVSLAADADSRRRKQRVARRPTELSPSAGGISGAGALATRYTGLHQGDCTVIPTDRVRSCG
jgi:hypothetical protein